MKLLLSLSSTIDDIIIELGLVKVTKRLVRVSTGNYTKYVGVAKHTGTNVPAVDAFLKKRKIKAAYTYDTVTADLENGITLLTYPQYKGACRVELRVPATAVSTDAYHTTTIKLLTLDKLNKDVWRTSKVKGAKGLRLVTPFTVATKASGKPVATGVTSVANVRKALKKLGYTATKLDSGKVRHVLDTNTLVEDISDYGDSAYTSFTLYTPGAIKDLKV